MKVTWQLPDGSTIVGDVTQGTTLMEAAQAHNVPLILGECGGNMSCATCHVVVHDDWFEKTGGPGEFEVDMLDATAAERQSNSRLSCQITADDSLDGLVLIVPQP